MKVIHTSIEGLLIIEPKILGDNRGYFIESFKSQQFQETVSNTIFLQDNESKSGYGVLRGLHFQKGRFAQAKLVRVVTGSVLDVAVDIRKNSPTFGKHFAIELNEDNKLQFFIPRGFAHGFVVLSDDAIFQYKCDNVYKPQEEGAIAWNDPDLAIDWKIDPSAILLSDKDRNNTLLKNTTGLFD